jgi:hypothetical protein
MFPHHYESSAFVPADPDRVFAYADNHTQLSSHMRESSWKMGGGRMRIDVDSGQGRHVSSHIRLSGRAFGIDLFVEEVVSERTAPQRKVWQTTGKPRLLVIGHYQMGFEVAPSKNGCQLRVFIDYALPDSLFARWLGYLFARYYAKWCVRQMVQDSVAHFSSHAGAGIARSPD